MKNLTNYKNFLFIFFLILIWHSVGCAQEIIQRGQNGFPILDSLSKVLANGLAKQGQMIRIGENVPDVDFKLVNFKSSTIKLSNLKGKLVILDFWSNGCSSCIAAMPRLEKLQQYFGDKLLILPISFQSGASSIHTLDLVSKKAGLDVRIPSIVEDTTTYALFTAYQNPFEAWINSDGKLIACTDLQYVTKENIQAVLDGKTIDFWDRSNKYGLYEYNKTNVTSSDSVEYGSAIREWNLGPLNNVLRSEGSSQKVYSYGSILDLYDIAYAKKDSLPMIDIDDFDAPCKKRVLTNFRKTAWDSLYLKGSYTPTNQIDQDVNRLYQYEIVAPKGTGNKEIGERMVADLDGYFKIYSAIEKSKINIFYLVTIPGFKMALDTELGDTVIKSKDGRFKGTIKRGKRPDITTPDEFNDNMKEYINFYPSHLVEIFNNQFVNIPIIYDRTGVSKKLHMPMLLDSKMSIEQLREKLKEYKLDLISGEKYMDVLVLTKKPVIKK